MALPPPRPRPEASDSKCIRFHFAALRPTPASGVLRRALRLLSVMLGIRALCPQMYASSSVGAAGAPAALFWEGNALLLQRVLDPVVLQMFPFA